MKTFYRDVLRSVAESLVKDSGLHVVVVGESHKRPENALDDRRLIFQSLWEHWVPETRRESRILFQRLNSARRAILDEIRHPALKDYFPFSRSVKALKCEFSWLFYREFKRLIPYLAAAKHILEDHAPALIVSADDADQRCRVFSTVGRERKIPSLLIQQGLSKKGFPEWSFFSQSKIAAMNASSRSDMTVQGVPPEKIIVTGHPGFDRLLSPEPGARRKTRSDYGLKEGQKMVLFASQPYYFGAFNNAKIRRLMIRSIVKAANRFANLRLVVKPHPGENALELKKIIGRSPRVAAADKTTDITDLIQACDVFITFFSTSALQALYAGKPVINVDFPESGGSNIYTLSGATWTARSEEEIVLHLENLLSGTKTEEADEREKTRLAFLREMTYIPDGKATERVTRAVLDMVHSC